MIMTTSESDDNDDITMPCLSSHKEQDVDDSGMCKECYLKVNKKEDGLKNEIPDLNSKIASPILNSYETGLIRLLADEPSATPIPIHKTVLVSHSLVFKAMLENNMVESRRSDPIKISEVSHNTLRAFVNYLYTNEASLDKQIANNLLVLGEQYQVEQLKVYCEKHLIATMNWDNALENYAFAHKYKCKKLLHASLEVIMDNMPNLTQNKYYAVLVNNNPLLIVDIYESYLIKQINTSNAPRLWK